MAAINPSVSVRIERHKFAELEEDCLICGDEATSIDEVKESEDSQVKEDLSTSPNSPITPKEFVHLTCHPSQAYHYSCLKKWLESNPSCPFDRSPLNAQDPLASRMIKIKLCLQRLDQAQIKKISRSLRDDYEFCEDSMQRNELAGQINFLKSCQEYSILELQTFADLLPGLAERFTFDGEYIDNLKSCFCKHEDSGDLIELLDLCNEEYLLAKEKRDQEWIENFFKAPWLEELKKGMQIFEESNNEYLSGFARGIENILKEMSDGSDFTIESKVSYAHILTGIDQSKEISFEILVECYERLNSALQEKLTSNDFMQHLVDNKAEIIIDFYRLIDSKVYDQLLAMHLDNEQKHAGSSSSSSSSRDAID